jgi:3-phenylpropionate/trans-cinnamate dioxygenase ferredoxin component
VRIRNKGREWFPLVVDRSTYAVRLDYGCPGRWTAVALGPVPGPQHSPAEREADGPRGAAVAAVSAGEHRAPTLRLLVSRLGKEPGDGATPGEAGRAVTFERVARSDEVQAPRFIRREANGRPVLLTRLSDGAPVAFGHICPHQNLELDEGMLWDDEIDCPHHHRTYDPRTGENRFPKRVYPARRAATVLGIPVYETREADGWVWVGPRRVGNQDYEAGS